MIEQSDGLAIATACIAELLHLPVQVAERKQQHTFLHAVPDRLLIAFLVGTDGLQCVFLEHVDVSDGVVHLVKVFLVVV